MAIAAVQKNIAICDRRLRGLIEHHGHTTCPGHSGLHQHIERDPEGVAIRFMASIVPLRRPLRRSRTRTASQFRRQRLAVALVDEPASMAVESYPPVLSIQEIGFVSPNRSRAPTHYICGPLFSTACVDIRQGRRPLVDELRPPQPLSYEQQ